jgi:hypothetical protein
VHAGEAAATESATAAKASPPPGVCMGEKGSKAYQNGEKKYQAQLETRLHDAQLLNSPTMTCCQVVQLNVGRMIGRGGVNQNRICLFQTVVIVLMTLK